MTTRLLKLFPVFLMILFWSGCDIINPEEEIPAFVYIEAFDLTTTSNQGTDSKKLTDVWFYVGDNFLGAFELPATIPILASGKQNIRAFPGIKDDGISALPDIYPFYTPFDLEIDLVPGEVDTIIPTIFYQSNTNFPLLPQEGFEGANNLFVDDLDNFEETKILNSNQDVFEGEGSGWIHLDQDYNTFGAGSIPFTTFPSNTAAVYLEMNYKSEVEIVVGVIGYDIGGLIAYETFQKGVNAKEDWNKIYFNFSEDVRQMGLSTSRVVSYQFCIHAQLRGELTEADIYLDNIKWLEF